MKSLHANNKGTDQNALSHEKYLDFLLILPYLLNPLSNQHFLNWKCICISRKVHILNFTSDNLIMETYSMGPD